MRSRLIKASLPGLPRTGHNPTPGSRPHIHQSRSSSAVQTFLLSLLVFLGLSFTIYSELHGFSSSRRSAAGNSILSNFTSKPPLVDRTILEKIENLDPEHETNSESFSIPINIKSSYVLSPFHRLPRVTRLPDVQPQAPLNLETETRNRSSSEGNADHALPSRKFLLPLKVLGHGMSAHSNLLQLLELARALNRTLVLPNVGKTRMGACRQWRFGVYFDEQALLSEFSDDSDAVIQQDGFRAWVESLPIPPSLQLVFLDRTYPKNFPPVPFGGQTNGSLGIYVHDDPDAAAILYRQAKCLDRRFPRLDPADALPPLSFVVDGRKRESKDDDVSQMLLDGLSEPTLTRAQLAPIMKTSNHSANYDSNYTHVSPDVLVISWNIHTPIFKPHSTSILHYSPQLRALAARLTRRLGTYIAVAWDVETSKVDAVLGCMEALRSTLHYLLGSHEQLGIRNIWLAGTLSPSDLVHSSEHSCASTSTENSFFASGVRLTGVQQELDGMVGGGEEVDDVGKNGDEVERKREVLEDVGILEILDTLVSARSTIFVTASKSCGKTSVFTKEVLDWRGRNTEKSLVANFEPRDDMVWGRTDRVVKGGGVVEFG